MTDHDKPLFTAATGSGQITASKQPDADVVTVACSVCGPVDDIDFGPFERRCLDLDTAVTAAKTIATEHAATCANRQEGSGTADASGRVAYAGLIEDEQEEAR